MDQLVIINNGQAVVSSRQIAENFEKRHDSVLRDIRNLIQSPQNCGGYFYETTYTDSKGRTYPEYLMNRDGFSLLVMGFTGEKALEWKIKYIEAFNRMEQELKAPKLMSDEEVLCRAVLLSDKKIKALETAVAEKDKIIEEQRPKVVFAESVEVSKDWILVRDMAKIIKQNGVDMGEKKLFKWLKDNGYMMKARNEPTQRSMELKVMAVKVGIRTGNDGVSHITRTPVITGKGQVYFVNKLVSNIMELPLAVEG